MHVRLRAHHGDPLGNGTTLVKVQGWYDNEWGYANRLVDLAVLVGADGPAAGLTTPSGDTVPPPDSAGPLAGLPLLEDLPDVEGRRVLVRVDFNVPLGHPGGPSGPVVVEDDFRIRAAMPTIDVAAIPGGVGDHLHPPGPPRWRRRPAL